ncbi:hypothetical protein R1flu_027332 [Riccia fluitans]|uniref:Uncharacterized protein n=1 Tax=Riccia fluitans TaxID=41844 RepID=A0ABD1XJ26_9MARC
MSAFQSLLATRLMELARPLNLSPRNEQTSGKQITSAGIELNGRNPKEGGDRTESKDEDVGFDDCWNVYPTDSNRWLRHHK